MRFLETTDIAGQLALPVLSDTYGDEDHHYVATARRISIDLEVYLGTSLYMGRRRQIEVAYGLLQHQA
jgi:hypothetical protein